MTIKSLIILSGLLFCCATSNAQFYTIQGKANVSQEASKGKATSVANEEDYFFLCKDSVEREKEEALKVTKEENSEFFSTTKGHEVSIEKDVPIFVSMKDSLVFGLIKQRMDVCLPLDYISVNSNFGYRKDPFTKCRKFHDGIDLECSFQHVYSMLPGKVAKVVLSNKGFGNHVVMDYGNIQVLYGHLSAITVREGDNLFAGNIIGISGASGRASGPHLHLKVISGKKVVDPEPFIGYLNNYITGLQDKIAYMRFGVKPGMELNIGNLYAVMKKYNIVFPKIVAAQALLETGYFSSNVCLNHNNLFGLRRPSDGSYYKFESWEESVKAYADYVQYKYKGGDYYKFLDNIGYSEDPLYLKKVRSISQSL